MWCDLTSDIDCWVFFLAAKIWLLAVGDWISTVFCFFWLLCNRHLSLALKSCRATSWATRKSTTSWRFVVWFLPNIQAVHTLQSVRIFQSYECSSTKTFSQSGYSSIKYSVSRKIAAQGGFSFSFLLYSSPPPRFFECSHHFSFFLFLPKGEMGRFFAAVSRVLKASIIPFIGRYINAAYMNMLQTCI